MKHTNNYLISLTFGLLLAPLLHAAPPPLHEQERVIILTDIEADPDDTQSLVRLFLYSNSIDIKGIVATTSCWKRTSIAPESIHKLIHAYGKIQPNLLKHEPGFPSAKSLHSLVKNGLPLYGMLGVGADKDSEGSELILSELKNDDPRPLWISVWGGVNTLAQTLHKIRTTESEDDAKKMISKLRVYTISDQDDSGIWIRKQFPSLQYIVSPGDHYGRATWNAINTVVNDWNNQSISNGWIAENIQQGHGPLGAAYPDVAWGLEGDTPAFLGIIPNGLNAPAHPDWGGWGGRYEMAMPEFAGESGGAKSGVPNVPEVRACWTDTSDRFTPFIASQYGRNLKRSDKHFKGNKVTLWRWRDDFQNDFAARMDWCEKSFEEANHPPIPALNSPAEITVKSGQAFGLDAFESTDPDGDSITFLWYYYPEAGSYRGDLQIGGANNAHGIWTNAPEVTQKETLHIILEVADKGTPSLKRYKRIVVTVEP